MDLIYLAHPVAPLPGSTETVDSNLADAEWWLTALQRANPDVAIIAPWIQELRLRIGVDSDPENRRRGLARCSATASRCDGIILCGPRISIGMLGEIHAHIEAAGPSVVHRISRRDQSLNIGRARTQASMHRAPMWLRWTWFGAFPQSAELVAQEILDADRLLIRGLTMTPSDLARAIYDRHCAAAAARNRPSTPWRDLTPFERARLEDDARRLQSAYASGCDAPSRGIR